MVRDSGKPTPPSPEALFSATQAPVPSSRRFWLRLLSRRPWLLLGGLWLVTVCVAAVASHRLLFTDPGRSAGSAPGVSSPARSSTANDASAPTARSHRNVKVTLWGLSSLVGLCALGSFVISQRAKATARRRPKRRVRRVGPKAKAPTGPKRLRPYSPQRDGVIVKGAQAVIDADTLPLPRIDGAAESGLAAVVPGASPASAPSPQGSAPKTSAPNPSGPTENDAATQAEVVPQDEDHPLDWAEDSLAHTLDLRQRRSLSSLM